MSPTTSALILAWIAIALLALACAGLLRQVRELRAVVRYGVGARATGVAGASDDPRPVVVPADMLAADRPVAILKVDSKCGECHDAARALYRQSREHADTARFVVLADRHDPAWPPDETVDVITDGAAYRSVTAPWQPALIVADHHGTVVSSGPARSPRVVDDAITFALQTIAGHHTSPRTS